MSMEYVAFYLRLGHNIDPAGSHRGSYDPQLLKSEISMALPTLRVFVPSGQPLALGLQSSLKRMEYSDSCTGARQGRCAARKSRHM